jgi:hypothetical protein
VTLNSPDIKDAFVRSLEITSKPSTFYIQSVKGLYLPFHWSIDCLKTAVKVLPYCIGVEYFVCTAWTLTPEAADMQVLDLIADMRPRRLSTPVTNLLGTPLPNLSLPFFDYVTHLEVTDSNKWTAVGNWSGIHRLPRLSHIIFDWDRYSEVLMSDVVKVVKDVLSHCRMLQVCVIRHGKWDPASVLDAIERAVNDDRLVFVFLNEDPSLDWSALVNGKPDTWAYAEAAVARQRQQHYRVEPRQVYAE